MNSETKICQNCKKDFTIEPEDFAFYKKIKVPPPTFCPECRTQRRMQWVNFRRWYRRVLDDKSVLSIYSGDMPVKIIDVRKWWSDEWDPLEYGKDYNFNVPFFAQFAELYKNVPRMLMGMDLESQDCDYCNDVGNSKNCYYSTTIINCENVNYSTTVLSSKDVFDSQWLLNSELCYECVDVFKSSGCSFSQYIRECLDSSFLFDCRNCSNCIACAGLRNAKYCIFNKQYTKEEYENFIAQNLNGSYESFNLLAKKFEELRLSFPVKYSNITHSVNVSGNNIEGAKNCYSCFDITEGVENCKFVSYAGLGLKDSYDGYNLGSIASLLYECLLCGSESNRVIFSSNVLYSNNDIAYSDFCSGCSHLFGCIGLKKKKYCILNKQYSKEKYEDLVSEIIQHMNEMPYVDKKGRVYKYGEFFPTELSPFAYNETIAQEHFPLSQDLSNESGYQWREIGVKDYKIEVVHNELPDNIADVSNDIIGKIIGCAHNGNCDCQCSGAFKIIDHELEFYRKMGLPLPRLCPNCRYGLRHKKRNPYKLWHRQCMCNGSTSSPQAKNHHHAGKCTNEFETSYSPDRPEIVYCEACYNSEVA